LHLALGTATLFTPTVRWREARLQLIARFALVGLSVGGYTFNDYHVRRQVEKEILAWIKEHL